MFCEKVFKTCQVTLHEADPANAAGPGVDDCQHLSECRTEMVLDHLSECTEVSLCRNPNLREICSRQRAHALLVKFLPNKRLSPRLTSDDSRLVQGYSFLDDSVRGLTSGFGL